MDAYEEISSISGQITRSTSPDERGRLNARLTALVARLPRAGGRKAEFSVEDEERPTKRLDIRKLYERAAKTDEEREAAQILDRSVMLAALLGNRNPTSTKYWQRTMDENPWLSKAMDTASAVDWIPEGVSAELHAQARLEMRVAGLLRTIAMPTASYKLPVQGNRPTPYLVPERNGADDDLDDTKRAKASSLGIGASLVLTAKKVGVRVVPSVELTEDSIVPALPLIGEEIISAIAVAREDSIINGKASGPHFDSDVTAADDYRKWYNGLRYFATAASAGNNAAVISASTAGRLELQDIRSVREKMGKYAYNPKECFWLTSVLGYNKLLGLVDSDGHQLVTTIDKFGPNNATLVSGSIAALDGFGIVVSEYVRSDCNHAGYFDGLTSDASMVLLVNTREFVVGDYRTATLKSREIIETDQLALVAMLRGDFGCYVPTANPWGPVGEIYDIRRS